MPPYDVIVFKADAYAYMTPFKGTRTLLRIGGRGIHAVKFLLAGALESWLITPILGEAIFSQCLASADSEFKTAFILLWALQKNCHPR